MCPWSSSSRLIPLSPMCKANSWRQPHSQPFSIPCLPKSLKPHIFLLISSEFEWKSFKTTLAKPNKTNIYNLSFSKSLKLPILLLIINIMNWNSNVTMIHVHQTYVSNIDIMLKSDHVKTISLQEPMPPT